MTNKPIILILGASSFLTNPLLDAINLKKKYKVICQTRRKLKRNISSKIEDVSFQEINFLNKENDLEPFVNCSYVINLVNVYSLTQEEIKNFRFFLKNILFISKACLIHISTASVYGNCKNKIISELSKCSPQNKYQKIKFDEEFALQKIAKSFGNSCFILRPTEIIGAKSLNVRKFIKSYISSSFFKRYIIKSLYSKRISHFVSSQYLVNNILKIIECRISPGTYIISQDSDKSNNFDDICKIIDSKIKRETYSNKLISYILPLSCFFKIIYSIFRQKQIPLNSKYISNRPIINPNKYPYFEKDLSEHIGYIINN